MYFDADEDLKLAIKLEALKRKVPGTKVIEEILKRELAKSLKEARKMLADQEQEKPG